MENPYDDEKDLTDYRIPRSAAAAVAVLSLGALALPPLWDVLAQSLHGGLSTSPLVEFFQPSTWKQDQDLASQLRAFEKKLDDLGYAKSITRQTQQRLTGWFGQGNTKVTPGRRGWLYYEPELTALNGWGPLKRPPFSVMKDPTAAKLPMAKDLVLQFAHQLNERGLPLLIVPVPVKPMLYPEHLYGDGPHDHPLYHPDQLALYDQLRSAGIDVLDLAPPLLDLKQRFPTFLKQDTHWTPEAMKEAARLVARHIFNRYPTLKPVGTTPLVDAKVLDRRDLGDLVDLLALSEPEALFSPETAQPVAITGLDPDRSSPIALLGDSFVNVFDDPTLGFTAADSEAPLRASFAQHLAVSLNQPVDLFAKNGGGATETRKAFAQRPDDEVRSKKLVVWVLAARDLLLSPVAARDAGVTWAPVTFNPNRSTPKVGPVSAPSGGIVVEAVLTEKSSTQDPNATPYPDALHTAVYKVETVVQGDFDPTSEWQAVQWSFKQKQLQPTANFTVGRRYRLSLAPWDDQTALQGLNLRDENTTVDEFTAERWWVESAEPLP